MTLPVAALAHASALGGVYGHGGCLQRGPAVPSFVKTANQWSVHLPELLRPAAFSRIPSAAGRCLLIASRRALWPVRAPRRAVALLCFTVSFQAICRAAMASLPWFLSGWKSTNRPARLRARRILFHHFNAPTSRHCLVSIVSSPIPPDVPPRYAGRTVTPQPPRHCLVSVSGHK